MIRNSIYLRGEPNKQLDFNTPFAVAGLIQQHLLLLQEHSSIPFEVVNTYDFNTASQLESVINALHTTSRVHLTIRARFDKEPLRFNIKPFFITSSFDDSGLVPLIRSKLQYNGIQTNSIVATNKFSYQCLKAGLIPFTLYLGAYHSIHDISEIDSKSTSLARTVASAIYSFITTDLENQRQSRTPQIERPNLEDCKDTAISASDPANGIFNRTDATVIAGEPTPTFIDRGDDNYGNTIYCY